MKCDASNTAAKYEGFPGHMIVNIINHSQPDILTELYLAGRLATLHAILLFTSLTYLQTFYTANIIRLLPRFDNLKKSFYHE